MKNITVFIAILLIIAIIWIPFSVLNESLASKPGQQSSRLHWQTGNTTRLQTENLATGINSIIFSQGYVDAVILLGKDSSLRGLNAVGLQLPIFPVDNELTVSVMNQIFRLKPTGSAAFADSQVILLGNNMDKIFNKLDKLGYKVVTIDDNIADMQYKLASSITFNHKKTDGGKVSIIIGHEEEVQYLLPALALAVHEGLPVFLLGDRISKNVLNFFEDLNSRRGIGSDDIYIYLFGREKVEELRDKLKTYGQVRVITDKDIYRQSVRIARYYDRENGFGWQANGDTTEGGHNTILINPHSEAKDNANITTIMASLLGLRGKFGPIVYTYQDRLPAIVEKYYWQLKPDFWVTPAEGPYNHSWVIGDLDAISFPVQGRADFLQEIQSYENLGEQGLSGLETIGLVWIITSFTAAIWIFFHLFIRLPAVSYLMKLAWILLTLITGPVGIWIYCQAYEGYDTKVAMGDWSRPLWVQGLVATISSLAFGASTMLVISFLLLSKGWNQIFLRGNLFVLGNTMLQSMLISYFIAFLLNCTIFMPTMVRMGRRLTYFLAIKKSIIPVSLSMTAVSLGMMGGMWWLQMEYLPMMPEESELLWFFTVQMGTIAGLLLAYPVNIYLVRRGLKKGRM